MKTRHYLILFLSLLWNAVSSFAGNLKIQNVSATANNITFDISWNNSWRSDAAGDNWDAVWVFVKVQDCQSLIPVWVHQDLANSAVHTAGAGLQVDHVTDGKGVFIRRSTEGAGNIASTSITLAFASAVTLPLNFDVVGIEMAYVPQGAFIIGSTADASGNQLASSAHSFGSGLTNAYGTTVINNENQIAANGIRGSSNSSVHQLIPASFPKGFAGFYCMKYELTQGQYCHFLNRLSLPQQAVRIQNTPLPSTNQYAFGSSPWTVRSARNSIRVKTMGNANIPTEFGMDYNGNGTFDEADDGGSIAMNWICFQDIMAYMDWAALRPMSELEYEKAARGTGDPDNWFPWGGFSVPTTGAVTIMDAGQETEWIQSTDSMFCNVGSRTFTGGIGPLRVGFAGRPNATRQRAGTSPYGIFDLSGNVFELTAIVPTSSYPTAFDGTLGDGNLNTSGNADQWAITMGTSYRGGAYNTAVGVAMYTNTRAAGLGYPPTTRGANMGGRGVRHY